MLTERTVLVGGLIAVCGVVLSAVILVVALANISVKQEVRLVGIVPSPQIIRLDHTGNAITLSIQGYYSDQSVGDLDDGSGAALSYASSYPSVVQVDSDGIVTGKKTGGADVTVTYGSLEATVPVFVWGPMRAVPPHNPDLVLEVSDNGSGILLNRLMVELEPGYNFQDARRVASDIDGEVVFEFRTFPGYLVEFDSRTTADLERALAILEADRRVAQAYPDLLMAANNGDEDAKVKVIETLQLPVHESWAYLDAGMEDAWVTMNEVDIRNFSPVNIAVIDAGFEVPLRDTFIDSVLRAEFDYDRITVKDAVTLSGKGMAVDHPLSTQHGTAVTSVIVAQNNDPRNSALGSFSGVVTSVYGIEYALTVYRTHALSADSMATAITVALEDMHQFRGQFDVVNMSMGFTCVRPRNRSVCERGEKGFRDRWLGLMGDMRDVTFVFAAGNDRIDARNVLPPMLSLDLPNVIAVGATGDRWDSIFPEREPDSNFGPAITLGASGDNVWAVNVLAAEGGYTHFGKTSFSAPMVSGTVALLKALAPEFGPEEVKNLLVESGNSQVVCTSNRPDFTACPDSDEETWTLLNSGAAVNELISSVHATIDSKAAQPNTARRGSYIEFSIPVVNTGGYRWNFHMGGVISSPGGQEIEFEPIQNVVQTNDTHPFKFGFWANEVGEWEIEVAVYRDGEKSLILDSARLGIRVDPPPAVTAVTQTLAAQPATAPVNVQSTPGGMLQADANVLVLADTSGSMDGEKIEQLKSSILEFVGRVDDPGEYIGLIDFDDDIEEVIPLGPFGVSLDPWNHAVEQLDGAGGTAFFDAVSHAINVLEMQGAPGRVNIIIALTDGVDQDSLRSASDVISELQGASVPVVLFALAYGEDGASGTDYDLAVLEQLAEATDGVAYVATPEDLERLFTLLATIF